MRNDWPSIERGAALLDAPIYPATKDRSVQLRRGSTIQMKPIHWLWDQWLPAGKLTILAGAAGTGKTTLALGLAATLTAGRHWPDGTQCNQRGNVLIWSSEDAPDDTLAPRLKAAGADLDRCFFIDGVAEDGKSMPFDPSTDISGLYEAADKIGGVSLLIIDPIVSAVAGDMNKANDVRRSLQSIVDFADAYNCAVLGITHFTKGSGGRSPQDRILGSQAFGALARMNLVAAKKEDDERRVLARAKCNIARDDGGVSYAIEPTTIDGGIETTVATWTGTVEGSAREILGDVEFDDSEEGGEREDAARFLRDLLSDGPLPSKQIEAEARGAGYSMATIRRAKVEAKIEAFRDGGPGSKGHWKWRLGP
ncbi:AAA family ATPase [Noviherbaspirillum galbum]|uniref:AAA family ATPase n=1 Tax=Noviherbaspirillum galbum TaxID=2709383 RepID=A0A6B3SRR5_9BURK|nr:AAA family ATPase [Noviherbaspirillum galbum]NEX63457.1 AAA family ATPase [Noviherbaspirillum galbum]